MIVVRETVSIAKNGPFMMENFPKLYQMLGEAGVAPEGSRCGLYYMWDMERGMTDMAVATQVAEGSTAPEGTTLLEIVEAQAATLTHTGGYSGMMGAHMALSNYMESEGLALKGPAIEEYLVDMNSEADFNKWISCRKPFFYAFL